MLLQKGVIVIVLPPSPPLRQLKWYIEGDCKAENGI